MSRPLYRHPEWNILIQATEFDTRGIGVADMSLGAKAAMLAMWDLWPLLGGYGGVLPIVDRECFEHLLTTEPAYSSWDKWFADPLVKQELDLLNEHEREWRQEWSGIFEAVHFRVHYERVRYEDRVYLVEPLTGWVSNFHRVKTRRIFDPDNLEGEGQVVPWKALVYLEETAREQVYYNGMVCSSDMANDLFSTTVHCPDGTTVQIPQEEQKKLRCANQPVGEIRRYKGREVWFKWNTRPYALVYDPLIGADRKVRIKDLE